MSRLKVGDTVVLHVEVIEVVKDVWFRHKALNGLYTSGLIAQLNIKEIIRHPIRVGDVVHVIGDILPDFQYTVLAVHGSDEPLIMPYGPTRRWAVCAHGDDIPIVLNMSKIECVD